MRKALVLVLWAVTALPALATAAAPDAAGLRGIWKIGLPDSAGYRHIAGAYGAVNELGEDNGALLDRTFRFGPVRDQFCRIGGAGAALAVHCMSFGATGEGAVGNQDGQFTLTWSGGDHAQVSLHGTLQTPDRFRARFIVEDERKDHRAPELVTGTRLDPAAAAQGDIWLGVILKGTLAALSLGDTSLLAVGAPDVAVPRDLAALGRVRAVSHIGEAPLLRDPQQRPVLDVYAVEFAGGERLCGIHLTYGKIDALRCV